MLSTLAKGTTTTDPFSYIETEARIQIRVTNSYKNHSENHLLVTDVNSLSQSENNWNPLYEFNMEGISTELNNMSMADSTLNLMNVVPNPYYAYSNYEFNRLDNVVKIVNLPEQCNVNIYNINGTLIKTFKKDNPITSVDWNLENNSGIPIASGMYLIHIVVPGIGERVLKWHGVVRQVDLDSF
jgi:flagellar hook assembly protein FlgD